MGELSVYLDGRIVPAGEAKVSVYDAGLLHGASAFTTMLAHNGVVFRLGRHLGRLMRTVELLSMRTAEDADALTSAVEQVLEANCLTEARMRITLTAGGVRDDSPPVMLVTAEPLPEYPREWYEKGVTVIVSSFRQESCSAMFGHKTGCYLPRVMALREAAGKGADEALWFTADNRLAEACFNNVFLVLDEKVRTPPLDTPVLGGVVREAVGQLCGELGIDHDDQTPLTVHEMLAAREVFLTASCSGIRPVVRIERHAVGDEKPGEITRKIMSAYRELLDRECKCNAGSR